MSYGSWTAPAKTRMLLCTLCALAALSTLALFIVMITNVAHGREEDRFALAAVLVPVTAAIIYFAARTAVRMRRMRVSITSSEVVIVGPLRTTRVPISDAQLFSAEVRPIGNNGQPMIALRCRGTEPVHIWALSRNGFVWDLRRLARGLQPLADELNERLWEAKGREPAIRHTDGAHARHAPRLSPR
jgi:hypothetical protein